MATFFPGHGRLVSVRAQSIGGDNADYDVTAISNPNWYNLYGETADIGVFSYVFNPAGLANTGVIPTKTIAMAVRDVVFRLDLRNAVLTPDYCDMDLEFLDAGGVVLAAIRTRWDAAYRHGLWYGPNLATLTKAAQLGSYPQTSGSLSFTDSAIIFTTDTGTNKNQSFSITCNTLAITQLRFSNLRAQSSYTGGTGGAYVYVEIASAPAGFDGHFSALTEAQYIALAPDFKLPAGAVLTHTPGVGVVASGSAPSYILTRGILPGQTGVLLNSSDQVVARLSYMDGVASLTVGGVTTNAACTAPYISLYQYNGQAFGYYQDQVIIRSSLFFTESAQQNWIELPPGDTLASIGIEWRPLPQEFTYYSHCHHLTATPANQEPRAVFQPQDVAWSGTPQLYPGPVNVQQMSQSIVCKGHDYFWVRDGVQNVAQGYISNRVTINGEGVRRRVLCFSQDGYLVAETYSSAADGVYRFDHLWLNRRYMLVAQDDPAFGPADYNAVAADYQAPTPYIV
ncbi:hypothetical protein ACLHZ7_15255 [Aeromonas salmonicida]|uniref:hypothetical protein n=1 Tax=Aeromonas salmonicida TaxID=645 RepID=UPI003CFC888C